MGLIGGALAASGKTRIAGVIGHPIAHSLSPAMHNAAFAALGMDWRYVPFDVEPAALADALRGMRAFGIVGLNVTIPHKPAVYGLVDDLAPTARDVEAVNTVHLQDGRLTGHNTDGAGFARSLEEAGAPLAGRRVVLLGAGGAARSVATAAARQGAGSITILNRTVERAADLARRVAGLVEGAMPVTACALTDGMEPVAEADIVVQCTSLGMHPHEDDPLPVPAEWIAPGSVAYDLIYNPAETRFLRMARERGARCINGVDMLVWQGAVAFQIWTGVFPPAQVMREALLDGLKDS
jgi:shikimate dehydrogenase